MSGEMCPCRACARVMLIAALALSARMEEQVQARMEEQTQKLVAQQEQKLWAQREQQGQGQGPEGQGLGLGQERVQGEEQENTGTTYAGGNRTYATNLNLSTPATGR